MEQSYGIAQSVLQKAIALGPDLQRAVEALLVASRAEEAVAKLGTEKARAQKELTSERDKGEQEVGRLRQEKASLEREKAKVTSALQDEQRGLKAFKEGKDREQQEHTKALSVDLQAAKQKGIKELATHLEGQKTEIATTQTHINDLNQQAQQLEARVTAARQSLRTIQSQLERAVG